MKKDLLTPSDNTLFLNSTDCSVLLNRFIAYIDASPESIRTYKKSLKSFFRYLQSNDVISPTREDVISYRDSLKLTVKPNTVQLYMVAVRLFFSWTQQEHLYPNIASRIKGAHVSNTFKRHSLTDVQLNTLFNSFPKESLLEKRDYAILLLMAIGGLRDIEVSRANFSDLQVIGNKSVLYIQGKGRDEKDDFVIIPAEVDSALRRYLMAKGSTSESSPLFISTSNNSLGKRLSTRSISGIVKKRLIAAGFHSRLLTAHSLRHSAATISILNGNSIEETQQFLRHKNINTTMVYLHHINRIENKSEERIANAIFKK